MSTYPTGLMELADEIERSLWQDHLERFFPASIRAGGGFHQTFSRDWTARGSGTRSIVFQARMTWVAAVVAGTGRPAYGGYARHGLRVLADTMWDDGTGSFHWQVDAQNLPSGTQVNERHAYGAAFAIFALAATARALRNDEALSLAQRAFRALDQRHHDPVGGGYWETVDVAGNPLLTSPGASGRDSIGTPYGQKSQNTLLHLMEAFAELYRVWPDAVLGERLRELLGLFRRQLYAEPGWLHGFVTPDLTPVPGPVSHGHDVEAAHLMLDAADALGETDAELLALTRTLVDYALDHGWHDAGGFYYAGNADGAVLDDTKEWWVQAEGMLALATMLRRTGDPRYEGRLREQWAWIRDRQIDREFGGWYATLTTSGTVKGSEAKAHAWKAAYHDGRAMLYTARLLRH